jgi:hypothetical protein
MRLNERKEGDYIRLPFLNPNFSKLKIADYLSPGSTNFLYEYSNKIPVLTFNANQRVSPNSYHTDLLTIILPFYIF